MSFALWQTLLVVCIIATITPGPNNFMILAASAHSGIRKALQTYLGVCLGFPLMVLAVSVIAWQIGESFIAYGEFVKYIGAAFLLYISVKLFLTPPHQDTDIAYSPVSFTQAFLFQWVNPKAWAMVLSSISLVGTDHFLLPAITFFITAFPCVGLWLIAGNYIRKYILGSRIEGMMNKVFGLLLAGSIIYIL